MESGRDRTHPEPFGGYRRLAPFVALLVAAIASLSLTGFAFNADPLYTVPRLTSISLQSATFLLVSAGGLMFVMADREPCRTLFEDSGAGLLARRSVPIMLGFPLVLGYFRVHGERLGLFDTAMGTALFALDPRPRHLHRRLEGGPCHQATGARAVVRGRCYAAGERRPSRERVAPDGAPAAAADRCRRLRDRWAVGHRESGAPSVRGRSAPSLEPDQARRWQAWTEQGDPLPTSEWPGPRALRGETVEPGVTFLHTAEDGSQRWIRVSAAPFLAADGETARRHRAAAGYRRAETGAGRAWRKARSGFGSKPPSCRTSARRKDEFLATLAHELRNPLAPIRTGLQMLKLSGAAVGTGERTLTIMERQINHLVRLIDDLLDVGRVTHGRVTLASSRLESAGRPQAGDRHCRTGNRRRRTHARMHSASEPVVVHADEARLVQVFANLLNNAAKFTPAGGRIDVMLSQQDGQAIVSIRDTGVGIPPAMLGRVFDLFTQVDRSLTHAQSGLGIGLSLVKGLVELHGGTVEGHSEGPGKGSTFTVRLPLASPALASAAAPPPEVDVLTAGCSWSTTTSMRRTAWRHC